MRKVLLLVLFTSAAQAAITYVGGASAFASANPVVLAYTATGGSGHIIVSWITYNAQGNGPGTVITSTTDTASNTYTPVAAEFGTAWVAGRMFYAKNPIGGALVIRANFVGTQTATISVTEYAGLDSTAPLGVSGNQSGTASPQTVTFSTCNATDVLVGGAGVYYNGTFTAGSPSMTIPANVTAGTGEGNSRGTTEYSIAPGAQTSATIAYSTTPGGLILQVAAFKEGSAAATPARHRIIADWSPEMWFRNVFGLLMRGYCA